MKAITGHPWLDHSAAVSNVATYTTTTDGSQIRNTLTTFTVACCVQPHTSREMIAWARDTGKRVSLGIFDPLDSTGGSVSINRDSILSITDPAGTARTYRAIGPSRNSSGVSVQVECDLEEVS